MTKRIVSLLLIAVMALSLVCAASAEETPSWKQDTSPVTLKVYYDRPVDAAQMVSAWGNEPVSKKWMEDTNVNVEWDYAPDESHSKLNMMIAGGDYPDIVISYTNYEMLNDLVANDVIIKYNELQNQYAPGFVDRHFGANMILSVRQRFATQDLYVLPTGSLTPAEIASPDVQGCSTGMMVLKSVYEAIGSPDMTTLEGTLDAFRKVKEMFPDMIPFQASRNPSLDGDGNPRCISKLFPFFELTGNFYQDTESGTYKKYWYNEKFYELLKFVNTLYNEGLMDPTELTDSGAQLQAKLFNGQIFANMNNDADNIDWFNGELANAGVNDEWIFIPQPSINTVDGYGYDNIMGGVGDHCVYIFNTPNAGRALQWLDYVMSNEAQLEINVGVQGISWDYNEAGVPVMFPEVQALTQDEQKVQFGAGLYHCLRTGPWQSIIKRSSASEKQVAALDFMKQYFRDYSFFGSAKPENYAADSEEIKIKTNVREYWEPQILQLIMCKPEELEAKYQETLNKLAELGQGKLDEVIAKYFDSKLEETLKYGSDLDLSYMGL